VVPGIEKEEDWLEHREGVLESLRPEGHLELVLAERVALLSWRLNRVTRYETETIAPLQEEAERKICKLRRLEEAQSRLHFVESLEGLSEDDPIPVQEALAVFMRLFDIRSSNPRTQINREKIPLPDPFSKTSQGGPPRWTAGQFRTALAALIEWSDLDVKELLSWAEAFTYGDVLEAEREAGWEDLGLSVPGAERDRIWGERILPDERGVEKIIRYEAHLGRELARTLDQLKALQNTKKARASAEHH
jgi:hypothetical protein